MRYGGFPTKWFYFIVRHFTGPVRVVAPYHGSGRTGVNLGHFHVGYTGTFTKAIDRDVGCSLVKLPEFASSLGIVQIASSTLKIGLSESHMACVVAQFPAIVVFHR